MDLQEHPILGEPYYMLHPCRTAEVMALLRSPDKFATAEIPDSSVQDAVYQQGWDIGKASREEGMEAYFVAWFSVYGGLLGLALPRSLWPNARTA